jgi:NADH-quinone oxidoreductase subunit M
LQLFSHHLLSVILFTPVIGALVLLLVAKESQGLHKVLGTFFGILGLAVCIPFVRHFPAGYVGYTFQESSEWIPSIGARYSLGVDGISFILVLLTALLGMIAIVSSWSVVKTRTKEYYTCLLLLQTGMLGVFVAQDLFLFYLFWEATLVPTYFLISIWGSEQRQYAAMKFFLYTLAGSVLMLLGILELSYNAAKVTGVQTFDIPTLLSAAQHFPDSMKVWLFWAFFLAFAIKTPMFPFHTWMPDTLTEAPTAVSVLLAGVLLKTGTYGFMRFSLPLLPTNIESRARVIHIVVVLSLIGIIYGSLICFMQKDFKRLIAYSSLSSVAFCTLGIFTLTPSGLSGSLLRQFNHGIFTGALFLLFGVLYERSHTCDISEFGGVFTPMPGFSIIFLIITLGALGMPVLSGFVGDYSILQGAFAVNKAWAAWAVLGILLRAAYLLWLLERTVLGPVTHEANRAFTDLSLREYAVLLPLVALAFWFGVYPQPFFKCVNAPVERILLQTNATPFRASLKPSASSNVFAPSSVEK